MNEFPILEEGDAITPAPPTRLQRSVAKVVRFVKANLAPNRVLLYLTAVADIAVALLALSNDLDLEQVSVVITSVAAVNAKVLMWVKGHQQMLTALYQRDLIAFQASAQADERDRALQAQQAVGRPGSGPKVQLPR